MAFNAPQFPLAANNFQGYGVGPLPPPPGTPVIAIKVQIKVYFTAIVSGFLQTSQGLLIVKVAKATPLSAVNPGAQQDLLEIPAASGRFYSARYVHEVAKGFPNEYRMAIVQDLTPQ